ncbi:leucyl aminopeptidase [Xenorhabdus sp. 12]|uniref:Leucyl aminopeptidase n=1 Tax=Xenorhabdus santafensis TaxID=2582833 RepID=A0ABU4SCS6_9GAMM|nr:leucyl aminopeptidase [Xenorhabdus sp. 12]MDX7988600.1 leucyl aminopeptidase [Xenorhabdus sp. 12]
MQLNDEENKSIMNMLFCLFNHPAVKEKANNAEIIHLLIGWDESHKEIVKNIIKISETLPLLDIRSLPLNESPSGVLIEEIEKCDAFMFFYLSSTLKPFSSAGPKFLAPIKKIMQKHWSKSILFKDYSNHFYESFSEDIDIIKNRNKLLIAHAVISKQVIFKQKNDYSLVATMNENQSWTSIDGSGNYDLTPGEIATKFHKLEGDIIFSGTFLSTIPFAIKYGIVKDFFKMTIKDSKVIDFKCHDVNFSQDFDKYLSANPSNSVIEEFGIGTNCGVKRLYGLNAGFEERHPGLHLGLGGGAIGSHHLDLIVQGGTLSFDENIFVRNNRFDLQ